MQLKVIEGRKKEKSSFGFKETFAGLSKFARLARSVTRSRSVLAQQFSSHLPVIKAEVPKQSTIGHVSNCSVNG